MMINRRLLLSAGTWAAAGLTWPALVRAEASQPSPFRIRIQDAVLADLRQRLLRTRWPDEVAGAGWGYGTELNTLRQLMTYWRTGFDWRAQERRLNRLPQFRAEVQGLGLHFVHIRGSGARPIPLLMLHGWPSTFAQFEKVIPLLVNPAAHGAPDAPSFSVVVPSLPGYGFSDRPSQPGMGVGRVAKLMSTLMRETLGYKSYMARGSDLGAGVLQQLALAQPEELLGLHLSGTNPYVAAVPSDLSPAEVEFVKNAQQWMQSEMAYAQMHASKPQTAAYGLTDSPVGLAAWIVEKFRRWGDTDGQLSRRFTPDELLTNLTIYWATGTIHSSMRLYYETVREQARWGKPTTPVAMLMTPKDMFPTPREWAGRSYDVRRWTEIASGGHFLEQEEPDAVAADLRAFAATLLK